MKCVIFSATPLEATPAVSEKQAGGVFFLTSWPFSDDSKFLGVRISLDGVRLKSPIFRKG